MKSKSKISIKPISYVLLLCLLTSLFFPLKAAAAITSLSQTFTSTSINQTQTMTFNSNEQVKDVYVDTGNASYTIGSGQITLNLWGSTNAQQITPTDYAYAHLTSSIDSFPETVYYSAAGYSGTLYKNGSSYLYSGSPAGSKYATGVLYTQSWSDYKWNGSTWVLIGSQTSSNPTIPYGPDSEGYSGTLSQTSYALLAEYPSPPSNPYINQVYRRYRDWVGYYGGTVYKPDTRVYGQVYYGTVYGQTATYYSYTVTIKTGPASELAYWESDDTTDINYNKIGYWYGNPSVYMSSSIGITGIQYIESAMLKWNWALGASADRTYDQSTANIRFYVEPFESLYERGLWPGLMDFVYGATNNQSKTQLSGNLVYNSNDKERYREIPGTHIVYSCVLTDSPSPYLHKTAIHEYGHAMGWYGHTLQDGNIMKQGSFDMTYLSELDKRHLRQFYIMMSQVD